MWLGICLIFLISAEPLAYSNLNNYQNQKKISIESIKMATVFATFCQCLSTVYLVKH